VARTRAATRLLDAASSSRVIVVCATDYGLPQEPRNGPVVVVVLLLSAPPGAVVDRTYGALLHNARARWYSGSSNVRCSSSLSLSRALIAPDKQEGEYYLWQQKTTKADAAALLAFRGPPRVPGGDADRARRARARRVVAPRRESDGGGQARPGVAVAPLPLITPNSYVFVSYPLNFRPIISKRILSFRSIK
jgi:hypothetical protein